MIPCADAVERAAVRSLAVFGPAPRRDDDTLTVAHDSARFAKSLDGLRCILDTTVLGGVSTTWSQCCDCFVFGCSCFSVGYSQDALCISSNVSVNPYQGSTLDIASGDDRLDTSEGD